MRYANRIGQYASLRQSANTRDTAASSNMGKFLGVISDMAVPRAAFKAWASALWRQSGLMPLCWNGERKGSRSRLRAFPTRQNWLNPVLLLVMMVQNLPGFLPWS